MIDIVKMPYTEDIYDVLKFPCTYLTQDQEGIDTWNSLIDSIQGYHKLERTASGWLSFSRKAILSRSKSYECKIAGSQASLIVIDENRMCFRVMFKHKLDKSDISGFTSFKKFLSMCSKHDVDLTKFKENDVDKAYETKMQIPMPKIWGNKMYFARDKEDEPCTNVHHIDIHSAHMAGVAKAFPELYPVINEAYVNRKLDDKYKAILTHTWGYLESKYVQFGYSHLSKAGIEYTNSEVDRLTEELKKTGHTILAQNTDGIWYMGDIYHGEGEGSELGQWSNDWQNCDFRMRSKGCYEFIGQKNGVGERIYKPVVRGLTRYDSIEPDRTKWKWGDIYQFNYVDVYEFNKETMKLSGGEAYVR